MTRPAGLAGVCMVCLAVLAPLAVSAIDTPPWTGPKGAEAKYRADWYACYHDAERTVPAINVQATGQQGPMVAAIAVAARNKSVTDLTLACMQSLGYEVSKPEASGK